MKKLLFVAAMLPFVVGAQTVKEQQKVYVPQEKSGVGRPVEAPKPIPGSGEYGTGKNPKYAPVGEMRSSDTLGQTGSGRNTSK